MGFDTFLTFGIAPLPGLVPTVEEGWGLVEVGRVGAWVAGGLISTAGSRYSSEEELDDVPTGSCKSALGLGGSNTGPLVPLSGSCF